MERFTAGTATAFILFLNQILPWRRMEAMPGSRFGKSPDRQQENTVIVERVGD